MNYVQKLVDFVNDITSTEKIFKTLIIAVIVSVLMYLLPILVFPVFLLVVLYIITKY